MSEVRSQHILVVDDEPNIRRVLRMALEMAGYEVAEAGDGTTAVQCIVADHFDLVILDLNMPVMSGMAVLQWLHARPNFRPRVIVLTAHGSIGMVVKAVRLGALDFLHKPVLPADLLLSVAGVMDEPSPGAAPSDATVANIGETFDAVRQYISHKDLKHAEQLMDEIAEQAGSNPIYYNLLGVIHEAQGDRRAAKTFYRKAVSVAEGYRPAKHNLQRLHELETYGETKGDVALGDEERLLEGFRGAPGRSHSARLRDTLER